MTKVTIHAAKTNLSKLIAQVEAGEEVVICRGDQPVAQLAPLRPVTNVKEKSAAWQPDAPRASRTKKKRTALPDTLYDPWSAKDFGPGVMDDEPDWGAPGTWDGVSPRKPGLLKGVIALDASFFDPATPEETGIGGKR